MKKEAVKKWAAKKIGVKDDPKIVAANREEFAKRDADPVRKADRIARNQLTVEGNDAHRRGDSGAHAQVAAKAKELSAKFASRGKDATDHYDGVARMHEEAALKAPGGLSEKSVREQLAANPSLKRSDFRPIKDSKEGALEDSTIAHTASAGLRTKEINLGMRTKTAGEKTRLMTEHKNAAEMHAHAERSNRANGNERAAEAHAKLAKEHSGTADEYARDDQGRFASK